MKYILLITALKFSLYVQKVKNYGNVQRVDKYDNGEIIHYKYKGKPKIDTIYFDLQRSDININKAELVNIYNGDIPHRKIKKTNQ